MHATGRAYKVRESDLTAAFGAVGDASWARFTLARGEGDVLTYPIESSVAELRPLATDLAPLLDTQPVEPYTCVRCACRCGQSAPGPLCHQRNQVQVTPAELRDQTLGKALRCQGHLPVTFPAIP